MNLRQLQAFKAVMNEGTLTQAADIMAVTQPAVSSLIANLEQSVGFPLFKRHKGRIHRTPEAERFYEEVEKVLSAVETAMRSAKDIRDLELGYLRIASMPGLSLVFLPRIVARFVENRPGLMIALQTRSSLQVKQWIGAQLYDLGLVELPVDDPAIEVEPFSMDCVCVLPEGHPLTAHKCITPALVDGIPFVSLSRDHMTHFRLKQAFEAAKVAWRPRFECQLFAPACSLVAAGAGISVIDPVTAADYEGRGVVTRPFRPRIPFDIGIIYPAMRPRSRLAYAFSALLKDCLASYVVIPNLGDNDPSHGANPTSG